MAHTRIEAERILPYAPADLCRLVGDVREYPKFIPFLQSLRVTEEEPRAEGGWEGVAEAIVGWKAITERFSTSVRLFAAILAGFSLLSGGGFGRVIGYIWAVLVIVQGFAVIGIAPWYSALSISLAALVIYGLASTPSEA